MEYNDEDAKIIKDALLKLYIAYDQEHGYIKTHTRKNKDDFSLIAYNDGYSKNERAIGIFGQTKLRNGSTIDAQFLIACGPDEYVWVFPLYLLEGR